MISPALFIVAGILIVGPTVCHCVMTLRYRRMIRQYAQLNLLLANCCILAWTMRGWLMPNLLDCRDDAGAATPPH
jgi:hypothetical protein